MFSSSFLFLLGPAQLFFEFFDGGQASPQFLGQRLHDFGLPMGYSDGFLKITQGIFNDQSVF